MRFKGLVVAIIMVVFLVSFVSSDTWGIWVRPLSSGSTQPSTSFAYYYVFSNDSSCSNILYQTESQNIQTDSAGLAFISFTLPSNLTNTRYICEYKNSSLRAALPVNAQFSNNTYLQNLSAQGNINSSNTIYAQNTKNLSLGYDYAINGSTFTLNYSTFLTHINWATANNGTLLNWSNALNNTLMQQANWNATNTSYLLTTNVTYSYSLNNSLWTLNYSDYVTIRNYALNSSTWTLNYTNFTAIYGYALNDSSWTLNYSNFSNIYANVTDYNVSWTNITNLSYFDLNRANTAGAFNQTFDTNTLFVNNNDNRVGIGTTAPNATLEVNGSLKIYDNTSTGTTKLTVRGGASQGNGAVLFEVLSRLSDARPSFTVGDNVGGNYITGLGVAVSSSGSFVDNGINIQTNKMQAVSGYQILWTNQASTFAATVDIGIGRNAAGVLEINNGTAANYADLRLSSVLATDGNFTTDAWTYGTLNLTSGYLYATNGTFLTAETEWNANASNFSTIYAGLLGNYTGGPWQANASNFTTVYGYALGWQNNATNFTSIYGGLLGNYTSGPWQGNASNFSRVYANVTDYNTSWTTTTNTSYFDLNKANTVTANTTLTNNYLVNGTGGAYIYHNGTGWVIKG